MMMTVAEQELQSCVQIQNYLNILLLVQDETDDWKLLQFYF